MAVSNWRLARAVSSYGQLGVVSATGIDTVLVRRLQDGDAGGVMRRAMAAFPLPEVAKAALERYFLPDGRAAGKPYRRAPMYGAGDNREQNGLGMLASFVEVFLAKEGHRGKVGVNLLTKVQLPNLPSLYGAMLAGVDYVLMGAGIPREIPEALDRLSRHEPAALRMEITELPGTSSSLDPELIVFDPRDFGASGHTDLQRPAFLPIVSSHSLASMLQKKATGSIEGFVVEGPTAGGHNAPPRVKNVFDASGQPVYGERDVADIEKIRDLGLPFWLAGGFGTAEGLERAQAQGAAGIQVGTLFAYCRESGLTPELKASVIGQLRSGGVDVKTDARASPTGFPFKVVDVPGTMSGDEEYAARRRVCDLGYLREAYRVEDGSIGFRCASEPVADYVRKGGDVAETEGRKCLCNALMADVGLGQARKRGAEELPLVTSGDDLEAIVPVLGRRETYGAADALEYLLARVEAAREPAALAD